jgi:hypothetical protein
LGFVGAALVGYTVYRRILQWENGRKRKWGEGRSVEEMEGERVSGRRYGDGKMSFMYGL